ncbi:GNAT family N-acetyltransferase [Micromonospora sp. NBC_01405]|uniref:GNAT family N-acetyltransferase n=1 Tax=Micromonospora sp. NBC_01405 TaxID=2903589 RepID=UPI003246B081
MTRGRRVLLRLALVDDVEVGWTLPCPGGPSTPWIHDIEVHPAHRGRGDAARMIGLVEAELVGPGLDRLGLNVAGVPPYPAGTLPGRTPGGRTPGRTPGTLPGRTPGGARRWGTAPH